MYTYRLSLICPKPSSLIPRTGVLDRRYMYIYMYIYVDGYT